MTLKKLIKWWLSYEVAVTGYHFAQMKVLTKLPALPLPSVLTGLLNKAGVFGASGTSVAGMQAITPDGNQFTLATDAVLTANGSTVLTSGQSYPVLSIQGNTYFLDNPSVVATVG